MTSPRIPSRLTAKYGELLRERQATARRLDELDSELAALSYALRVLDPDWAAPTRTPRKPSASRLPHGALSRECLSLLKSEGALWTPQVVQLIAARRQLVFSDRKDELDFASAVAMALRRYAKQGLVETVDRDPRNGALRWRLCLDDEPGERTVT